MAENTDPARRRAELSEAKRALLEKRLRGTISPVVPTLTIRKQPEGSPAMLSSAQRRFWFLYTLDPQSPAYNMHSAVRLSGPLNTGVLEQSLAEVVKRHAVLRTTFKNVDGQVTPVVAPAGPLNLMVRDLREHSTAEREEQAHQQAFDEIQHPFNLVEGPLMRVILFRLDEQEHILLVVMHHIVTDEWSLEVFWREVSTLYEAFLAGRPFPLPELPIAYTDYAYWQHSWLGDQGEDAPFARQLAFWKQQLRGTLPVLQLPTDRPRPPIQTYVGALQLLELSGSMAASLKALAKQENASLFVLLLAAFKALLYRYTGQTDLLVGTPITNRSLVETEGLLGLFLNSLALRTDLSDDPGFLELLRRVRKGAFDAFEHQELPFEKLVSVLQPERDMSRNPLFQVMFVFLQEEKPLLWGKDLRQHSFFVNTGGAKFDLTLFVQDTAQGLTAMVEYNTDLFDEATIERMLEHLQMLLEGIAENASQRLSELPLLTQAERHQLLVAWNQTQAPGRADTCMHPLFEEQVEKTPEAEAVVFDGAVLTYRVLNERANQLARHLQVLGVGPETLVGIFAERSLEMVVGLLAILKAGGAYVPLDPVYPRERLAFILQDAAVSVLLTQQRLQKQLPPHDVRIVCLDADQEEIERHPIDNLHGTVQADNLAYVIYTSGSTGQPRGVMVTHRNLVHSTTARKHFYKQSVRSFLLLSTFAFDSSVAGLFWTLSDGGALCIPHEELYRDPAYLAELIAKHRVSHILCIPQLYHLLLETGADRLRSLTMAMVAGEVCPVSLVEAHKTTLPSADLYNEYGPTEATVWATAYRCGATDGVATVPIGRPIPNVSVYVLDTHLQPVPTGVPGELFIGGAGVARGYLNRPDQTGERFIENPFKVGSRIYKTGDWVRYLPDGNLEFLGRRDHQVKLRGYRIELGEIEAVLAQHPSVQEAVVIAQDAIPKVSTDPARLVLALQALDPVLAERLLKEVEQEAMPVEEVEPAEEQRATWVPDRMQGESPKVKRHPDFDVVVHFKKDHFIDPPRKSQRDWLLSQLLDEVGDDLVHLDKVTRRFVPGHESRLREQYPDISQAALTDQEIMEDWQVPIMKAMAAHATEAHGDVLEVGFGRGVSSTFIQESGVRSHTVVESNDFSVKQHYEPWRQRYANQDIRLLHGRWEDLTDRFDLYDGILFHAFPLDEAEFIRYVLNSVTFAEHFFPTAAAHLKPGGVFTYLTTEIDSLSRRHQRLLFKHFSSLTLSVTSVSVPEDTHDAWWADTMVIIKAVK